MSRATPRARRGDRGQVTVMILGFFVLVALVTVVVVDASAAYLQRQSLNNLADGAALAAADGVQGRQVYDGGLGETATIDANAARGYVRDYLRATDAMSEHRALRWDVSGDGESVRVRLTALMDLPLSPPGWDTEAQVSGEAAVLLRVY